MISNSRPVTKNIDFGFEMPPSTRVADTYSDALMDDLFMDVDQILEGDLSSYMTVVGHKPRPTNPSTRTVQLPPNFVPTSAADLYRVAVSSNSVADPYNPTYPTQLAEKYQPNRSSRSAPAQYSQGGGRPVTSARGSAAYPGNLQSAVLPSPNYSPGHSPSHNPNANLYGHTYTAQGSLQPQTLSRQPDINYLYATGELPELTLTNASARPTQTIFEPQAPAQPTVSLPFLLMGAAGISAVSTLGLWTLSQSAPSSGWLLSLSREATAAEIPEQSTEDFLAYLQQSLEVISAKQQRANQTVAVIPVANGAPTLPTTVPNVNPAPQMGALPNLPGAPTTASPGGPGVIERVFVPVYQNGLGTGAAVAAQPGNPPMARATSGATAPLPSVAVPRNRAQRPTVPVPAPVAAAAAIPPGAPAAALPSLPIVPVGAAALPTPNAPVAMAQPNTASNTTVTPNSEHVLVGILNLGSRSAALFNIDGSSQRAYVGDRVGVSDWSLVSVNGQDVVVRRNGEVRSIYIGQKF
jgi:hypothetical protein